MKTYCTNSIVSFEVIPNKIATTLVYIPRQRAFQRQGFLRPDKMIIIEGGWYFEEDVDEKTGYLKNCNTKPFIPEEFEIIDITKCNDNLRETAIDRIDEGKVRSLKTSNFFKALKEEWGDNVIFETETYVTGVINKINIYNEGYIQINITKTDDDPFSYQRFYKNISKEDIDSLDMKTLQGIYEYPFFKDINGNLTFIRFKTDYEKDYYEI